MAVDHITPDKRREMQRSVLVLCGILAAIVIVTILNAGS